MRLWAKNPDDQDDHLIDEDLITSEKSPTAYRTISEVAAALHLPQHVLRFWESKFPQVKPLKRGGGRRFYKPEDVDLLRGIRHLLYSEGYTIKGVQKLIKANGVKAVQSMARLAVASAPLPVEPQFNSEPEDDVQIAVHAMPAQPQHSTAADVLHPHPMVGEALAGDDDAFEALNALANPSAASFEMPVQFMNPDDEDQVPIEACMDEAADYIEEDDAAHIAPYPSLPRANLSADSVRQLQSILFELNECRRVLDAALTTYAK